LLPYGSSEFFEGAAMGGFELNKIMGAIILAGLVGMLSGFAADKVIAPETLKENVYKVEGVVAAAGTGAPAAAVIEPISGLLASADLAKGEAGAKACAACHSFDKGGPNKVGPNLWNVVGGPHAHAEGFAYSTAMKALHDKKWNYEALNEFLVKPSAAIKGTKMAYAGMKNPQDRANLIAWLRTKADSPVALP
jgi:cytochrome c